MSYNYPPPPTKSSAPSNNRVELSLPCYQGGSTENTTAPQKRFQTTLNEARSEPGGPFDIFHFLRREALEKMSADDNNGPNIVRKTSGHWKVNFDIYSHP